MIINETPLAGACIVDIEPRTDFRGLFARTWCREEFAAHGLSVELAQMSTSFNRKRGTLRGLHYQVTPFAETKLVRCTRGAIHDVIVDLRRESRTFLRHFALDLTEDNRRALYIPEGFAHGFQTLQDETEVLYQMSAVYSPEHARGLRWNDPALGIDWPVADPILIDRDAMYPDFAAAVMA